MTASIRITSTGKRRSVRRMFASLALMILMGCAATMPPPSVVEDPAAGRQGQSVEAYLRMKEQELSDTAATLHALGRGGEVEGLREQVTRSDAIGNADLVGDGPEQRAAVRDALELTAAQYMASVGIILESAETAGAAGFDVAASAARLVTGTSGFHDFVALAEQAFVGRVQSVRGDVSGRLISVRAQEDVRSPMPARAQPHWNRAMSAWFSSRRRLRSSGPQVRGTPQQRASGQWSSSRRFAEAMGPSVLQAPTISNR